MTDFKPGDRVKILGIENTGTVISHAFTYAFGGYGYEVDLDNDGATVIVSGEDMSLAPKEEPGIGEHFTDSQGREYVHIGADTRSNAWVRIVRTKEDATRGRRFFPWEEIREA